jgi:hypothetical protein
MARFVKEDTMTGVLEMAEDGVPFTEFTKYPCCVDVGEYVVDVNVIPFAPLNVIPLFAVSNPVTANVFPIETVEVALPIVMGKVV